MRTLHGSLNEQLRDKMNEGIERDRASQGPAKATQQDTAGSVSTVTGVEVTDDGHTAAINLIKKIRAKGPQSLADAGFGPLPHGQR